MSPEPTSDKLTDTITAIDQPRTQADSTRQRFLIILILPLHIIPLIDLCPLTARLHDSIH